MVGFCLGLLGLAACVLRSTTGANPSAGTGKPENQSERTESCTFPLVKLQTGQDSGCSGGNIHAWPVGMDKDDCHAWESVDTNGRLHQNSANHITCNADGTFSFTQFAGSLTCEGGQGGVTKTYALNSCQQDIPPRLYTKAIDLTCCLQPDSPECQSGVPSVSAQAESSTIYLNGKVCSMEQDGK